MSPHPQLSEQAALILEQSEPQNLYQLPFDNRTTTIRQQLAGRWTSTITPMAFVWEYERFPMVNEQVILLKALFASLDQEGRDTLPPLVLRLLNERSAKIIAHFLTEIRRIDLISALRSDHLRREVLGHLWNGLRLRAR